MAQRDGRLIEMYLFAALVYFVICLPPPCRAALHRRIAIIREIRSRHDRIDDVSKWYGPSRC